MEEIDSIIATLSPRKSVKKPGGLTPSSSAEPTPTAAASQSAPPPPPPPPKGFHISEENKTTCTSKSDAPSGAPPPPPPPPKGFHVSKDDQKPSQSPSSPTKPPLPPPPPASSLLTPPSTPASSSPTPPSPADSPKKSLPPPPPPPPKELLLSPETSSGSHTTNSSSSTSTNASKPLSARSSGSSENNVANTPRHSESPSGGSASPVEPISGTAVNGVKDPHQTSSAGSVSSQKSTSSNKTVAEQNDPVIGSHPGLKLRVVPGAVDPEEAERQLQEKLAAPKQKPAAKGAPQPRTGMNASRKATSADGGASAAPQGINALLGDLGGDVVRYSDNKYKPPERAEGEESQRAAAAAALLGGGEVVRFTDSKVARIENPTRDAVAARKAMFLQMQQKPETPVHPAPAPRARPASSADWRARREELEKRLQSHAAGKKEEASKPSEPQSSSSPTPASTTAASSSSSSPPPPPSAIPPPPMGPIEKTEPRLNVRTFANAYFDGNLINEMLARGYSRSKILDAMYECYNCRLSTNDPDLLERKLKELKHARQVEKARLRENPLLTPLELEKEKTRAKEMALEKERERERNLQQLQRQLEELEREKDKEKDKKEKKSKKDKSSSKKASKKDKSDKDKSDKDKSEHSKGKERVSTAQSETSAPVTLMPLSRASAPPIVISS